MAIHQIAQTEAQRARILNLILYAIARSVCHSIKCYATLFISGQCPIDIVIIYNDLFFN